MTVVTVVTVVPVVTVSNVCVKLDLAITTQQNSSEKQKMAVTFSFGFCVKRSHFSATFVLCSFDI
jgi:hypothetical protein